MRAEVVANFPLGDYLVEKVFSSGAHVPPPFAAATGAKGKFFRFPFFAANQLDEHFMYREMAKVQERREAAADFKLGLVALLGVEGKLLSRNFE